MTLPVTLVEAEALEFARDWIARGREGDFLGLGYSPLHPDAGRAFLRRMIRQYALGPDRQMLTIIDCARAGWDDADLVLRDLILEYTNRGEPLPAFLATYNAEIVTGRIIPRPRGRKRAANLLQDISIVTLVLELIERFGLKPTRYQAGSKRRPSACSVAAGAMAESGLHRGDERAIQQIWLRYAPAVLPGSRAEIILN
jgi:hypothetical protein